MDHVPVHFEIPADDPEKLGKFYKDLFGWKIEKYPGPMEYWMVETAPEGKGVNGGMMKRQMPQQQICVYFSVESVDQFAKKIKDLGGQIVFDKHAVPKMGYFAVALDPQHNAFAIWEMDPSAA
jgi:predicted enzyme related to lactoylglutathione lyase